MRQLLRFGMVGALAAAVHFLVVSALVARLDWQPLVANVAAFLTAFVVSYSGQHHWTFAGSGVSWRQGLPRYFLVSCGSFVINELLYAALLAWTSLSYQLALGITLVVVAALTFVSSRYWAFRASERGAA